MCGFAGVVTWDEKYRVTRDTLEKMSRAVAHRGPDGERDLLTREHEPITPDAPQVGLAFRRLAILDPDPRSNQPFTIGPLTLVFNGEIYNFRDLKSEISKLRPDYHWRTTGDTEVLLVAYEVWREKCVEKLNGMFAFAVWDEQKKELFLARDRMGQKPLYYCFLDGGGEYMAGIVFASEIGAILSCSHRNNLQKQLRMELIQDYLRWGYSPNSSTIYSAIAQLKGSNWLRISAFSKRSGAGRYFEINSMPSSNREESLRLTTREKLMKAVERQLVSDVPLGVFLSGGIDSSVISAAARKYGPVQTFSIAFDDSRFDESQYAREVAKHLGTNHHEIRVTPNAAHDLPKLATVFGEPFGDSSALPTHYLARETRKHVKVALSGDGGDELFGGYDRYRAMQLSSRLAKLPRFARHLAVTAARTWKSGHPKSTLTRAARLLGALELDDAHRYSYYVRLFDDKTIAQLINRDVSKDDDEIASAVEERLRAGAKPAEAGLAVDRMTYLPDDLLTKVDRCSMLHGLEVRSPFMDHELVQFAAGLTTDQLLKGGPKRMLREAFAKDLPDFVFKRRKMGFAVPIGEWFRGELKPMLRDNLFAVNSFGRTHFNMKVVEQLVEEHETQRADHSQRLYALLMLELWWQQQGR
ncbi:MAG TPA: asparagine synthase (glutamine-hydrolyzing) [Tepidisphaeraceae bacterium]|nr:asparagine synthase (glutamine-hydrolyzing) [Tepidisphaeraceae bacterium]